MLLYLPVASIKSKYLDIPLAVLLIAFTFIISLDFLHGNEKLEQYSKEIISLKRY